MDRVKELRDKSWLILDLIRLNIKEKTSQEMNAWITACIHAAAFIIETTEGKGALEFKKSYVGMFRGIADELEKEIKELSNS